MYRRTLVIFSMFRTDFNRISISRRVAMLLAPAGAAPSTAGLARRPMAWRASIVCGREEDVVEGVRDGAEADLVAPRRAESN